MLAASRVLRRSKILAGDFYKILKDQVSGNDFVYLDPPYAMRNAALDNQYGPDVFGINDIARLRDIADFLDKKGARFVISYANCEEIGPLRDRWASQEVIVRRTIAASATSRGSASEVLITNI